MGIKILKPLPSLEELTKEKLIDTKTFKQSSKQERWALAKSKFLSENLIPGRIKPYTLRDLAVDLGMAPAYVRAKAGKEGWTKILAKMIAETNEQALVEIKKEHLVNEIEIRQRQMSYSRIMQSKAIQKLQNIKPDTLTVAEATNLLKIGAEMERIAAGLATVVVQPKKPEDVPPASDEQFHDALAFINSIRTINSDGVSEVKAKVADTEE